MAFPQGFVCHLISPKHNIHTLALIQPYCMTSQTYNAPLVAACRFIHSAPTFLTLEGPKA